MAEGQCTPSPEFPCRVNLDLMAADTTVGMYAITAVAMLIFAYGIWTMVARWRGGQPWSPRNWKPGLKRLTVALASHGKFRQDPRPGLMHQFIFWGFVALFVGTTIVAIDADIFELILGTKLLFGSGYLIFEFVLDLMGVVFIVGVGYAIWRRLVERPPHVPTKRGDMAALWFLLLIAVTGYMLEGLRLRHQINADGIDYAGWSFVGNALGLVVANWSPASIQTVYPLLWWTHFALWSATLAVLPWTKLNHIVTSSLNIFFHDPDRQSRPELGKPFDLQEMMDSGDAELPQVGKRTIRDFTWKDRLTLDACTNCGRCESQCPATAAGRPLSPRKLIQDLKGHMYQDWRAGRRAGDGYEPPALTEVDGLAHQIQEATLWSCTTCRACVTACPVDIEHVDLIVDMRRALVMESKLDEHQSKLLVNLQNAGNPYGFPASDRADWVAGLPAGVKVPTAAQKQAAGESFEYLWWVGCSGSFDPRNQEVTRSVATILNAAGVDFAILGQEERCNGDPARRLGEEGRFQQSVMENLVTLQQYGVKKVIAQCPHCFNTLQNEYPEFGAGLEVVHHAQLIERLLEDGKIPLQDGAAMNVTYHDSCYLGRHNGIFDAPRNVLQKLNPDGLPVLEMAQSGKQGLCCGAGGANMWYEIQEEDTRINVIRAKQAADTGADTVASACPFCLTMLKDGLSLTGNDPEAGGAMVAQDLAEIVAARLEWQPPEQEEPAAEQGDAGTAMDDGSLWVG